MKSSENINLIYIFPEKVWLPASDVFVFAIYWSFPHHQNTIQKSAKNVRMKNAVPYQVRVDVI